MASAQDKAITVSRVDGAVVSGKIVRITDGVIEMRGESVTHTIRVADALALHGGVPRAEGAVTARLVGGDEIRGDLRGGDATGESLVIASRSLGGVSVAVDRLQALVVHRVAGEAAIGEFEIPVDDTRDEVLFLPARRGFDTVQGAIHRFTVDGIVFAPTSSGTPRPYGLDRFAAVAIRGGKGPAAESDAVLLTRGGDVLATDLVQADANGIELLGEGKRHFTLPWEEVATLLFRGDDRLFLSELQPESVEEGTALADDGSALYPWRRDRNVRGGFLVVGGRTYARGLGVHSRCVLTYRIPEGYDSFCTAVGIDDEVDSLPARGDVDIAILVDGKPLVERTGVRGGSATELGALPVRGGGLLTLRVDFGAGLDLGDRVDWLGAVLVRRRTKG